MPQVHVQLPPIPLIKGKYDGKLDKDIVKLKFPRDPTSGMSDFFEFKISLFDNGRPEEVLFFVHNFNITPLASGTLDTGANVQYLHTLVHE